MSVLLEVRLWYDNVLLYNGIPELPCTNRGIEVQRYREIMIEKERERMYILFMTVVSLFNYYNINIHIHTYNLYKNFILFFSPKIQNLHFMNVIVSTRAGRK